MSNRRSLLISARKAKGLRHEDIARLLGIDRTTYSRWESGERTPRLDEALRLAALLGRTVEELFGPDLQRPDTPAQDDAFPANGKVAQAA